MKPNEVKPGAVDEYIDSWPHEIRQLLLRMRDTIRNAAPAAAEKISYGIPTFTLYGNLVHFAAFKNHIGFYPGPSAIVAFKKELSTFAGAKGSVQFPYQKPLPLGLVSKIVKFRVKEVQDKVKQGRRGKKEV